MITNVDHVAIGVKNLDEALQLYEKLFGLKPSRIETIPSQGVKAALLPLGTGEIELLEPIDPQGGVAKFVEKSGGGIHHIALEVDDVDKELETLGEKDVALIDKKGRPGMAGKIGFLHPKSTGGVLVELCQKV